MKSPPSLYHLDVLKVDPDAGKIWLRVVRGQEVVSEQLVVDVPYDTDGNLDNDELLRRVDTLVGESDVGARQAERD